MGAIAHACLWLLIVSGCVVFVEPSPFEIAFLLAAAAFALSGLRLPREALPLVVLLTLFNVGGLISLVDVANDAKAVTFVAISIYLACVAIFFTMIMMDDTGRRVDLIMRAQIVASLAAAITGVLGYFNVMGTAQFFTSFEASRASGMFKDPNVFGPFITVGATALFHGLLTGRIRHYWLNLPIFCLLSFAILISFSRGSWAAFVFSMLMVMGINFLVANTGRQRRRVVVVALFGAMGLIVAGLAALSVPTISTMIEERAKLTQSYDEGETGRFGKQRRSIPVLLDLPNGLGPLQFHLKYGENPHNVYVFAFSSYGWLGGIAYFTLILITCVLGWRLIIQDTPLRHHAIMIWSALFPQIVQGIQIDTDHWRHFWWLLGIGWGIAIVSNRRLVAQRLASVDARGALNRRSP